MGQKEEMVTHQNDVAQLPSGCPNEWSVSELDEDADGGDCENDADARDAHGNDGEDRLPAHVLQLRYKPKDVVTVWRNLVK